jgi:hypothetical protein
MYLFDNISLPASALITSHEFDSFYDGPFNVSDDEEDAISCARASPLDTTDYDSSSSSIPDAFDTTTTKCDLASAFRINDDDEWLTTAVDEYSYARVRDTLQDCWISFAYGVAPWKEEKVFVFGPEGEAGERSKDIFEGRRRQRMWREVFEPLGYQHVQKVGVELSRGPALGADRI